MHPVPQYINGKTLLRPTLTFLSVIAFHVDAENWDLLPLGLILEEVHIGDGDGPGGEVALGPGCAHQLC